MKNEKSELLQSAVQDLKRLLLQNGYPQGITFNVNDALNKNKNKPNEPIATVRKKDVTILLSYIALHSNHITKRLKSCVNWFYSFVNVKVIFLKHSGNEIFLPIQGPSQPITIIQSHL